jgi:hypothetical protein
MYAWDDIKTDLRETEHDGINFFTGAAYRPVAGFCEHGKEILALMNCCEAVQ